MKRKASLLIIVGLLFFLGGCTDRTESVTKILQREGYENIELTGRAWFACAEDDFFSDGFSATKNDMPANGVVCSGLLKGSTIRVFD